MKIKADQNAVTESLPLHSLCLPLLYLLQLYRKVQFSVSALRCTRKKNYVGKY